jgi:polygalacturonase
VHIADIAKAQVHGHFATVTIGPGGTNIDFGGTDITVVPATHGKDGAAYSCEGRFVPMQ